MEIFRRFRNYRLLQRSERLSRNGDRTAALNTLLEANRREPEASLEQAIVDLLLSEELTRQTEPPGIQAEVPISPLKHRFVSGEIPEVDATDLTAPLLQNAIADSGYLVVRNYFAQDHCDSIRQSIDESLNARADAVEAGNVEEAKNAWYYASPHFPGCHVAHSKRNDKQVFSRTGSIRVIDSPRGTFRVLEAYRERGIKQLVEAYFGQDALIATRKWVFRLIEPIPGMDDGIGGGWHQDGQFMGDGVLALNMWVALTHCGQGTSAPGITLLPKRIKEIVEFGTRGAKLNWAVGSDLVEELAADAPIISPTFAPGDALFFDHYSLHRSGHASNQTENRYALESWFYAKTGTAGNAVISHF